MDRRPTITSPSGLGGQIFPSRKLPPYLTLRQLEQQGTQWFGDLFQAVESEEVVRITNRAPDEAMKPREGAALVHLDVTGGMKRDRPTVPSVGMNAQGDLLCHGPAHEEGGSRHSEKIGEVALEFLDHAAVAVSIGSDVGRKLGKHPGSCSIAMPGQPPGAGTADPIDLRFV
jgi:hypothetical protein